MASIHGFTDGSFDYKHMYNIKDRNGPLPYPTINPDTIFGTLALAKDKPYFQEFARLLIYLRMDGIFNNSQANFTVFVPETTLGDLTDYDAYFLRKLVLYHTIQQAYPVEFLTKTKAMFIYPKLEGNRILVENIATPTPLLNRQAVIKDVQYVNGSAIYTISNYLQVFKEMF